MKYSMSLNSNSKEGPIRIHCSGLALEFGAWSNLQTGLFIMTIQLLHVGTVGLDWASGRPPSKS